MSDAKQSQALKLKYKRLGHTGLKVSEFCLGTMTFGESNQWGLPTAGGDDVCHKILDAFVGAGGNFIDTADVYGTSEEVIGRWLVKQKREDIVIATKVRGQVGPGPNDVGLSAKHILAGCEKSLRRLQTNYIDLYQVHGQESDTPLEETMQALNDLVRSGKVRYVGVSNWPAWQIARANDLAQKNNWAAFTCLQPEYNLLCRSTEWDLVPACQHYGLGIIPWSPLAGGWLAGRYKRDAAPEGGRVAWAEKAGWQATGYSAHNNEHTWGILDTIDAISKETGRSYAQVSLRWLMQKPGVTAPTIGARDTKQLMDNLATSTFELTAEQMQRLDKASAVTVPYPWSFPSF